MADTQQTFTARNRRIDYRDEPFVPAPITRFAGAELKAVPAPLPSTPPGPFGDLSRAPASEIVRIVERETRGRPNPGRRQRAVQRIFAVLEEMEGSTWQERWEASGFDSEGADPVRGLAAPGDHVDSGDLTAGIKLAFCLRVIRPSISGFRANTFTDFPERFRELQPDPYLEKFFAAVDGYDFNHMHGLRAKGRRILPTAAVIDAQTVKASPNAPEATQGYDGGKRVKGRKRHIATDTLGLLLVLIVTAAGVQDTNGGKLAADELATKLPTVTKAWVDAGYKAKMIAHASDLGIDVEVVSRDAEQKGFVVQKVRWRVEQTFGIMSRYRRLHRDYEALPTRSRSMIHWSMVNSMANRLTASPNKTGQYLRPKPPAAA